MILKILETVIALIQSIACLMFRPLGRNAHAIEFIETNV